MGLLYMGGSRAVEEQRRGYEAPPWGDGRVHMRHSSSNIFHTSLAVHRSTLTARRTSMRVSNRGLASQSGALPLAPAMEQQTWKPPHGSWSVLSCGGSPKEGIHESRSEH